MEITKTSTLTGITRTMDIPVTPDQIEKWEKGELIQIAMPELTPEQREFLMTGATQEEWDQFMDDEPYDYPAGRGE